jgi:hypothetical protein
MLYLILFFIGDTTTAVGNFSSSLYFRSPSLNFMSLGYSNPILATGVLGAVCNPAGLTDIKDKEFVLAGGIGTHSNLDWNPVIDMGEEVGELELPLDISFANPGGINFLGAGIKLKKIAIGIGFTDGMGFGSSMDGAGKITYTFNDTIWDTLTSQDISELPAGTEVPVIWTYKTPVTTDLGLDGKMSYSERNFFLCLAGNFGPFEVGAGMLHTPISGKANGSFGLNVNAPCSLECTPEYTGGWETDITGHTIINQKLVTGRGLTTLTGNEFSWLTGFQIKLGVLNLGASASFTHPAVIKVSGDGSITHIANAPHIDSISYNPANVDVDTTNSHVQGEVDIILSPTSDTTEADSFQESYKLPGRTGITMGSALKVGPFTVGGAIGGAFSSFEMSFWSTLGLESKLFFPLRASLSAKMKGYRASYFNSADSTGADSTDSGGGLDFIPIPSAVLDIGSSFNIQKTTVYLGFRTNPLGLIMSIASSFNKDMKDDMAEAGYGELPGLFSAFSPVFGVSIRF